jgi:hypothetical protein
MVIEFYTESPQYEYQQAKYVFSMILFPEIDNQESRIVCHLSSGWSNQEFPEEIPEASTTKNDYRYSFIVNDNPELIVEDVQVTISGDGIESKTYNSFDNPDNVRIVFEDAFAMVRPEDIVWKEDGSPDQENAPSFYAVKCMFNEFPSDNVNYLIEVVGNSGEIVLSESGTISIVEPPWVAGIEI